MTVEVRPRAPWETVDLGVRMARHWWWPLARVWLVLTLPLFVLLLAAVPSHSLWIPMLVMWWTKPLWERALLFMLSRVLFGELPSVGETLKAFPKTARPQLIAALTWRRLSPYRSMDAPVSQLEGLRGERRRERLAVLRREGSQPASWLTIIGIHVESFLGIAAVALIWVFIPDTIDIDLMQNLVNPEAVWPVLLQNVLAYAAAVVVAPFYVATGFALYLNRRTRLEGWDIEIAFRQMVQKRATPVSATLSALLVGLMLVGVAAIAPGDVHAANLTPAEAKQDIQKVMAGESFHSKRVIKRPALFDDDEKEEPSDIAIPEWWLTFMRWLASSLEMIFWSAVILLAVFLAFRYRHWLAEFGVTLEPDSATARPQTLFGLNVRKESLPRDVPAEVRRLWEQGLTREALSLLYRACLIQLINDVGITIEDGDTEMDCLNKTRAQTSGNLNDFFARVTRQWQRLAYGHLPPETAEIEALCHAWPDAWLKGSEFKGTGHA